MEKYFIYILIMGLIGCSKPKENNVVVESLTISSSHLDNDLMFIISSSKEVNTPYLQLDRDLEIFRPVLYNNDTIGKVFNNTYWFRVDTSILIEMYDKAFQLADFDQSKIGIPIEITKSDGTREVKIILSEIELESFLDQSICSLAKYEKSEVILYFLLETIRVRSFN
ncbi:hypothetical protein [Ekhidna sp.]